MIKIIYSLIDKKWLEYVEKKDITRFFKDIFSHVVDNLQIKIPSRKTVEISIVFTNDKNIQELNREFRKVDKPTNVLSFPMYGNKNDFLEVIKFEDYVAFGDIVLSVETIERESLSQEKTFKNHLIHLTVHSILHLFGYDHIKDKEAEEMENLEIDILKNMNIENPYL